KGIERDIEPTRKPNCARYLGGPLGERGPSGDGPGVLAPLPGHTWQREEGYQERTDDTFMSMRNLTIRKDDAGYVVEYERAEGDQPRYDEHGPYAAKATAIEKIKELLCEAWNSCPECGASHEAGACSI